MKRTFIFLAFLLVYSFSTVFAQEKITSITGYTASNEIGYYLDDTIRLGKGSGPNENFVCLQKGNETGVISFDPLKGADKSYSNQVVTIEKVNYTKINGQDVITFTVSGRNFKNYILFIEDAIAACEVAICKKE